MTNGANIAAQIDAALREAATATGAGHLTATLTRQTGGPATPWDTGVPGEQTFTVTVLDDGITTRYSRADGGALIPRTVHAMMISATGEAPQMGDTITVAGVTQTITSVAPFGPGGVVLYFDVEVEA